MGFEYGCFVSYMHPEHPMMVEFMEGLVTALNSELEPFVPKPLVYLDSQRLQGGVNFTPALSRALCASACWIVVYVPQYQSHDYCLREYRAMQLLEEQRRQELGAEMLPEQGMIVPVILRGDPDQLPDGLGKRAHCLKFNRFATYSGKILRNRYCIEQIEKLAPYVKEIHDLGERLSFDCTQFSIPELDEDPGFKPPSQPFPGNPTAPPEGGET